MDLIASPTLLERPASRLPIGAVVRVVGALAVGLLALLVVRIAAATLGRRPRGLAALTRCGSGLAARAGLAAAVLTAARARRHVPAYRAITANR